MREKLIELLIDGLGESETLPHMYGEPMGTDFQKFADYLLENNVVVLPCKVGDEGWCIVDFDDVTSKVTRCRVEQVDLGKKDIKYVVKAPYYAGMMPMFYIEVNKVFSTAEEAIEALKRSKQ